MKFTHVKSKHSKDKDEKGKFECKSCGKRFKSAYYLKTHSRKVHSDDIKVFFNVICTANVLPLPMRSTSFVPFLTEPFFCGNSKSIKAEKLKCS